MKKIININFHSRVIPIEETAYDILRKYVDSLKKHFAGEEGGDEIVNDIENRFAELFSDRLKKGATCITDADVEEIITSMGRPEDFDQDETSSTNGNTKNKTYSSSAAEETAFDEPRRLYRSENDKMLGGVCGGIAAYLRIDSSIVRILFALLTLGLGTGILVYIVLWLVLPPKSMITHIRKRLFRDPEHRVIGGVASGLASYFNIEIWIPRVIFCLPLIFGILKTISRHAWFEFGDSFSFIASSFGGGLTTLYIILWIVLPEAKTASEKLEMRGEKIDLESIKNTIKSDLEGFKQKATVVGGEIKQKAEEFGNEMKSRSGNIRRDLSNVNVPSRGIGHAIGVLFKAFFLFISVIIAFVLVMALIGLSGAGVLPLKYYFIHGFWQNIMAWCVLILFLLLPVIGILTWLIRRIIGVRRGSNYLGYIFGGLWVIGLISFIFLLASFSRNFNARNGEKTEVSIISPANGKMIVRMDDSRAEFYESDWMGINWHHNGPFFDVTDDSVIMNNVRIDVVKSEDSVWHLDIEKLSRGNTTTEALNTASAINFEVNQHDSLLTLARGFAITPKQQFRNQQVVVIIKVPVGKRIFLSENLDDYRWFNMNRKWRNNGVNMDWEYTDDHDRSWDSNVEYIMTDHGLERTGKNFRDNNDNEELNRNALPDSSQKKNPNGDYRYHKPKTTRNLNAPAPEKNTEDKDEESGESSATFALLTNLS